ncbi:hypothetical protein H2248_003596 [Termitomyces sp. 'cryptogamus']|nr:hypothetical protein H2248_003596 [Termitomyces sp. 'cryptogamus']
MTPTLSNCAVDCYDCNVPPAEIYDLDILEALQMAHTAWKEVDTTTIQNCWKTGILPDELLQSNGPASTTSLPVSSFLNIEHTQHTDPINTHKNWMEINELLNPINEDKMHTDGTKEANIEADIFLAVVERCKAEENREEKAGDAIDDSEVIDERLSCQEAPNTVSTILKYVSTMEQPYAH